MKASNIIWDFDGTLLPSDPYDSEQSLLLYKLNEAGENISVVLRAWARILIYADNHERLCKTFKRFYVRLLKGTPVQILDQFCKQMAKKIPKEDRQALLKLRADGHKMMILSCGTADLSERVLKIAELRDCFDIIEGNRFQISGGRIKGMNLHMIEPEDKVKFLNQRGIASDTTIAVGDGYSDIPMLNWSRIPIIIDRSGNKRKRFSAKNIFCIFDSRDNENYRRKRILTNYLSRIEYPSIYSFEIPLQFAHAKPKILPSLEFSSLPNPPFAKNRHPSCL